MTNEAGEMSAASRCSRPLAWAVVLADGERIYDVYAIEEEAKAIDEAVTGNHGIVPLYRHPQPMLASLQSEIDRLRGAIRRLAEQDATLSLQGGAVTVTVDATLTDAEQLAIAWAAREADEWDEEDTPEVAAHAEVLRGLARRLF